MINFSPHEVVGTTLLILKIWICDIKTKTIPELLGYVRSIVNIFLRKCYKSIIKNFDQNFVKISGKDVIVEIYESKFVKNKHHKGHQVKGVWVF
jgi:hypothetical protein